MKLNYNWSLQDANFTKDKGKVFSCFSCGGGSTMGYKLAGFDVIGCNEIDPKIMEVYIKNHNPKFSFLEGIQTFKNREDLPIELFDLDILDGSPPCSSFSMAGSREKDWGKEKKFREGQTEQILDTLFFDFIDLAKKLQPKVVVAENVKGMLLGNAKQYVIEIYKQFDLAGYYVQHFLLNASKMGVPQKRERVFFIAIRKDLGSKFLKYVDMFTELPELKLDFSEKPILFKDVKDDRGRFCPTKMFELWEKRQFGDLDLSQAAKRELNKDNYMFNQTFVYDDKVCGTLTAKEDGKIIYNTGKYLSDTERIKVGSFPYDYNFLKLKTSYLIGMSVPPLMVAKISNEIYKQWLSKL